jgi:hypothetical protein
MRRRLALGGIVVALAITAAACGSGGGTDAVVSIKTLQAAVDNTQHAPSSRFTMDISVDASGKNVAIHAEGVASGDGKQGNITMTLPTLGTIEERIVDGTVYMDFSDLPFASELGGKRWVSVSLDELQQKSGTDFGALADQAQSNGPQQGLAYLQGLSGDVEKVGDDTVADQHATHYRASIDYAKVAAEVAKTSPETADKLAKLGTVPADVWINDDDRVVKMHLTIDGGAMGAGAGTAEMTMEITDFGVPVDVQAPPADETVDLFSLPGQTV